MLAPQHRVTRGVDYRRISRGTRVGGRYLAVHGCLRTDASAPTRFGFIITKRVGVAVTRNRLRRQLKAICFEALPVLPTGMEFVIRLHPEGAQIDYQTLRTHCRRQLLALARKLQPERDECGSCSDEVGHE
ncbi:ribonuclease P protein component [Gulosibacter hominis]|uniref:ribonuclease P protein component n=1 Tax=Gulosibacter hominis TaxID=2770504 RepID=UPI00191A8CEC|nr:ribonuclease P protein component [Gulosibacter hominis]